ncbi:DUF1510 family protein [Cytobacillus sp. FJAT-54145]|uniref:DUF1510 family protein n=1 Tax=Cytobacillus spartinae TaxID=3299023 RepID=A0ABW6KGH2_9BACI
MQSGFNQSRYDQRSKKRKSNIILNSLIGVVVLLIGIVSATIFLGEDEEASTKVKNSAENNETTEQATDDEETEETNSTDEDTSTDEESNSETETVEESDSNTEDTDSSESGHSETEVITEGSEDPNVLNTIVDPSWQPVGTTQTGEHVNVYGGVDWDEMVKAISYATDIPVDNMTIHFLGNNGHNKSVGTVYPKGKQNIYRVYIEWVDGQGWKPTKVEELAEIIQEEDPDQE